MIGDIFVNHPEIMVFLSVLCGYGLSQFNIGRNKIEPVAGTLLVGLILGAIFGVTIPTVLKDVFFNLFLFSLGYSVGPQFFAGLNRKALDQIFLTVFTCIMAIAVTIALALIFKLDAGYAAGLAGGGLTQTPIIGTASSAIEALPIDTTLQETLINHVSIGYAISYPFGTMGGILFILFAPRLLRIILKDECRKLEKQTGGTDAELDPKKVVTYPDLSLRVYEVTNPQYVGELISKVELTKADKFFSIQQIRRNGKLFVPTSETALEMGDIVAVSTKREIMVEDPLPLGPEVVDAEVADVALERYRIVLTNEKIHNKRLEEVAIGWRNSIYLQRITRGLKVLPHTPQTVLQKGDVLDVMGGKRNIESLSEFLGVPAQEDDKTDVGYLSLGMVIGSLVGLLSITVAGIALSFGTGVGCLILGLILGWYRLRKPTFGHLPVPAQIILSDLGLTVFIAIVGLEAGPGLVEAFKTDGITLFLSLFIAGVVVTMLTPLLCLYFGKYILKMNPIVLLGGVAGVATGAASLNPLLEESESRAPTMGYALPYAISNVLLTFGGPVIVMVMVFLRGY
jgi:putative transport protein